MQLPSLWYGTFADVKSRTAKAVTALKRGASPDDALAAKNLIDATATPGLLVLQGPSPLVGTDAHFHCYAPWRVVGEAILKGRLDASIQARLLEYSLAEPWGVLGVLGQDTQMWLWPEHTHAPFLDAAVAHWPALTKLGPRYSLGSNTGAALWSLPTNLQRVLARRGIAVETLGSSLPRAGLADLVAQIR